MKQSKKIKLAILPLLLMVGLFVGFTLPLERTPQNVACLFVKALYNHDERTMLSLMTDEARYRLNQKLNDYGYGYDVVFSDFESYTGETWRPLINSGNYEIVPISTDHEGFDEQGRKRARVKVGLRSKIDGKGASTRTIKIWVVKTSRGWQVVDD